MSVWLERIRTFLSTVEEWHSFIIGLAEVGCFWKPRLIIPEAELTYIKAEWHYYMMGRACGILVWIGLIALLKTVILG